MTANDIITRALQMIGVRAAETPVTAAELQDGLDLFNDMMAEWEGSGVQLGHTTIVDASAEVEYPSVCSMAMKSNLAVYMCPEYGRQVSPALAAAATESYKTMVQSLIHIGDVSPPSTLPVGSGNKDSFGDYDHFFPTVKKVNF